jgi:hypothetical protein
MLNTTPNRSYLRFVEWCVDGTCHGRFRVGSFRGIVGLDTAVPHCNSDLVCMRLNGTCNYVSAHNLGTIRSTDTNEPQAWIWGGHCTLDRCNHSTRLEDDTNEMSGHFRLSVDQSKSQAHQSRLPM